MRKKIRTIAGGGFNSAVGRKTAQKTLKLKLLAAVVCAAVTLFTSYGKDNGAVTVIAKSEATITTLAGSCSAPLWSDGYVASLNSFSWWNCGYFDCLLTVMGKVTDCNGEPIPSVTVTGYLTGYEASSSITASTDSKGRYKLQFPAYSDITITVKSSDYGNYVSEVSYAIKGGSGGTFVVQDIELPCVENECTWNGDTFVVINDITWATRNLDAPGTFACSPERYGMFYQWNRNIGWSSVNPLENSNDGTTWDGSTPSGTTWESANDPSPAGCRVPTYDELNSLLNTDKVSNEWTVLNGVNGRRFTDKTTGKSLFLPAAGFRYHNNADLSSAGTFGYYWGNTQRSGSSSSANDLRFTSGYAELDYYYKGCGYSVRCVADVFTTVMGEVTDCNGSPLPDVRVTCYQTGYIGTSVTALTDSYGSYRLQFPTYSDITIAVKSSDYGYYTPEVLYAIQGVSGGASVVQDIELPCEENRCTWNGDTSVVINGVTWATRNVDAPGTFAASPESAGMLYQWNCNIGWSSTDPRENSNGGTTWRERSIGTETEWESANDPSPAGWRVPTKDELYTLLDTDKVSSGWIACNGVNGRLFVDKTTGKSLFLPAAGYRTYYSGTLNWAGTDGYYWSSTSYCSNSFTSTGRICYANGLSFHSGNNSAFFSNSAGCSVRCVKK